jgi:hypothetical protein
MDAMPSLITPCVAAGLLQRKATPDQAQPAEDHRLDRVGRCLRFLRNPRCHDILLLAALPPANGWWIAALAIASLHGIVSSTA